MYMEQYKDELLKLFKQGTTDSEKEMNPGKVREQLMTMFPHKFLIPSETKIKIIHPFGITKAQVQKQKLNSSEQRGRKPKDSSALIWISALKSFVENHISESPEAVYKRFFFISW